MPEIRIRYNAANPTPEDALAAAGALAGHGRLTDVSWAGLDQAEPEALADWERELREDQDAAGPHAVTDQAAPAPVPETLTVALVIEDVPGLSSVMVRVNVAEAWGVRRRFRSLRAAGDLLPQEQRRDVIAVFERPGRRPLLVRAAVPAADLDVLLEDLEEMDR